MPFVHQLKLSARRKTVAIKVSRGEVFVYAPKSVCKASLYQWLETKKAWVEKKVGQTQRLVTDFDQTTGAQLVLFGKQYRVNLDYTVDGYEIDHDEQVVFVNSERQSEIAILLEQLRTLSLQQYLNQRLAYWTDLMNVDIASVKLRFYKSRWGSCDSRGRLTFNTRLVALPSSLIDYVIVHELAHRKYLNHSPAFWSLVSEYYPNVRLARKEINAWAKVLTQ